MSDTQSVAKLEIVVGVVIALTAIWEIWIGHAVVVGENTGYRHGLHVFRTANPSGFWIAIALQGGLAALLIRSGLVKLRTNDK